MSTITRVATLELVLARGGRLEKSRANRFHYEAVDEIGGRFDVWVNAVAALERRGALEIVSTTDAVITYRLARPSVAKRCNPIRPRAGRAGAMPGVPDEDQS